MNIPSALDASRTRAQPGAVALVLLVVLAGCGIVQPSPALRIPQDELKQRIDTICLWPVPARGWPEAALPRLRGLEQDLAAALAGAGFKTVAPEQPLKAVEQVARAEGGYFDPHTGLRDEARYDHVRSAAWRELASRFGCDAVLYPTLRIVTATWVNGTASWDGVADSIAAGWGAIGYVPALSLRVEIRDAQDREIYFGTGGIQVVMKLEGNLFFSSDDFARVPVETLLADPQKNARAIRQCLGPLLPPTAATDENRGRPARPRI